MEKAAVYKGQTIVHPVYGSGKVLDYSQKRDTKKQFEVKVMFENLPDTMVLFEHDLRGCGYFYEFGIFGGNKIFVDSDGYIDLNVIIQESGLYAGAPPAALRIHSVVPLNDEEFGKQYVAKLNRKADLPFYLTTAKVKISGPMKKWSDEDLIKEGISTLPEEGELL
jgi:hypothetical protein